MSSADSLAVNRSCEVDLVDHHGQCEMNFHLCLAMAPGCREERKHWHFKVGGTGERFIHVKALDKAPYTTTLEFCQSGKSEPYISPAKIVVRLYHDVGMAEVVGWDDHRNWLPVYDYPNTKMYQMDEKLALNRFLGEWLVHCRKLGIYTQGIVNRFS